MSTARNDPCPCGSGLRFKKCCGVLDGAATGPIAPTAAPGILPTAPPGTARPDMAALLKQAIAQHQSGNLHQAATIYRDILMREPNHADALHLAGLVAQQSGDADAAVAMIAQAIRVQPSTATFHANLGNVLQERGELPAACASYETALALKPDLLPAAFNLGNCMLRMGQPAAAVAWYERALALQPDFYEAACGIGNALLEQGQAPAAQTWFHRALQSNAESLQALAGMGQAMQAQGLLHEAQDYYRRALKFNPANTVLQCCLGQVLLQLGQTAAAVVAYEAGVRADAGSADARYGLANAYFEVGELTPAIASYQQAIALRADFAEAHYNLGNVYKMQDRTQEALLCYQQAVKCQPDFFAARWAECMAQLPVVYKRVEEIAAARTRYREALEQLDKKVRLDTPQAIDAAVSAVTSMQPFYLAYQGQNDCELQQAAGALVTRIMAAKYPQWSMPLAPAAVPHQRLRVGFVSAFFFDHSNWKMPLKGWVEQINPDKFALYGYYTGKQALKDAQTDAARSRFKRFVEAPYSIEQLGAAIRADELDVLIYPEIGMSPLSASLAALRLAPVQCTSWGHPQTSGLPTIDYFLSSDLMEPADAQQHYSEQLVRLPNLSVYCELSEPARTSRVRSDYGLADDRPLYFCAQSLFKYLPQYDMIFPAIAEKVGKCQFAFIDNPQSPELTQRFIDRLAQEFRRKGLASEDYVIMLPHLQGPDYVAINQLADVFLDSIGWNGCNSTLEAIQCKLPVVTLPGQLMRARHSDAILKMIGIDQTIATDIASYIDIAARLGSDPEARRALVNRIADNKHLLDRDQSAIAGLEKFLQQVGAA